MANAEWAAFDWSFEITLAVAAENKSIPFSLQ